jgi:hypothetical protein
LLRDAIVEAAKTAPGLTQYHEEQEDAGFAHGEALPEGIPISTHVGPH